MPLNAQQHDDRGYLWTACDATNSMHEPEVARFCRPRTVYLSQAILKKITCITVRMSPT